MILSAEEEKEGGKRTIPTVRNLQRKSRIVRVFLGSSKDADTFADGESESFRNLKATNYKKEPDQGQTNSSR